MGFLSYGSAKGLSYQHDFGKDMDRLYKREAYRSQLEAQKEQKTQYYAQLMKEHTAAAPSMTKELEGYYKKLNNKIADFAINNPGFETDVNKMQEFLSMTDGYLNNEYVRKDIQSQQQFEKLKNAYNTKQIKKEVFDKEMERYTDWMENGGDGYVFANITLPTYDEIITNSGKLLQPDQYYSNNKKTGVIENVSKTDIDTVRQRAVTDYTDPNKKIAIDKKFEEVNKVNPGMYHSALDMHEKILAMGEPEKRLFATWNQQSQRDLAGWKKSLTGSYAQEPNFTKNIAARYQVGNKFSVPNLVAFTPFLSKGKSINLSKQGTEIKIPSKDEKGWETVNIEGSLKELNTTEMRIEEDGAYTMSEVEILIDATDETIKKKYEDAGFAPIYKAEVSLGASIRGGDKSKLTAYRGNVLLKANVNEATIQEYEKLTGGQTFANKLAASDPNVFKDLAMHAVTPQQSVNELNKTDGEKFITINGTNYPTQDNWAVHPRNDDLVYRYEYTYDKNGKQIGKPVEVIKNRFTDQYYENK